MKLVLLLSLLLLLLLAFPLSSHCADLYLNATSVTSCTATSPCYLQDPALWMNTTSPSTNDSLHFTDAPNTFFFYNATITLNSILLNNNVLILRGPAAVTITDVLVLGPSGALVLQDQASLVSLDSVVLAEMGTMELRNSSSFTQYGYGFNVQLECTVAAHDTSSVYLYTDAFISGALHIPSPSVQFFSYSAMYFTNTANVNFYNTPYIYYADFQYSNANFYGGWAGANYTYLSASNVTYWGEHMNADTLSNFAADKDSLLILKNASVLLKIPTITGVLQLYYSSVNIDTNYNSTDIQFYVSGACLITADAISFSNITADTSVTTGLQIIAHYLNFTRPFDFSSSKVTFRIQILHAAHINSSSFGINGNVYSYGRLYLEGTIFINGILETTGSVVVNNSKLTVPNFNLRNINTLNDFTVLDSVINGSVYFSNYTLNYANAIFVGAVTNNGILNADSQLIVQGYYEQRSDGVLIVDNVDLQNINPYVVASVVSLAGTLKYSLTSLNVTNLDVVIVTARSKLTGTFATPVSFGRYLWHGAKLVYTPLEAYLVLSAPALKADATTWIVLVSVLAPVVIIGLIVGGLHCWRKRGYTKIPMHINSSSHFKLTQ